MVLFILSILHILLTLDNSTLICRLLLTRHILDRISLSPSPSILYLVLLCLPLHGKTVVHSAERCVEAASTAGSRCIAPVSLSLLGLRLGMLVGLGVIFGALILHHRHPGLHLLQSFEIVLGCCGSDSLRIHLRLNWERLPHGLVTGLSNHACVGSLAETCC